MATTTVGTNFPFDLFAVFDIRAALSGTATLAARPIHRISRGSGAYDEYLGSELVHDAAGRLIDGMVTAAKRVEGGIVQHSLTGRGAGGRSEP